MKASGVNERLQFATLAAHGAVIERSLRCQELPRFAELVTPLEDLRVRLAFTHAEDGQVRVRGRLETQVALECHRCLEAVPVPITAEFDVLIVREDDEATFLGAQHDVMQVPTDLIGIGDLVEDELILAVPTQVCTQTDCATAPKLEYPAADQPDQEQRENPFQVLERLKDK